MEPSVGIVVPFYNDHATVKRTLEGILSQTYGSWICVIVNDGSTASSTTLLNKLVDHLDDERFLLIGSESNIGAGGARNLGLKVVRSYNVEFVAFCDSDDVWYPNKLAKQIETFELNDAFRIVCSGMVRRDKNFHDINTVIPKEFISLKDMLKSNHIPCSSAVFKESRVNYPVFPDMRKRQDYAFWLEILSNDGIAYTVQEPLIDYCVQPGSLSSNLISSALWHFIVFAVLWEGNLLQKHYFDGSLCY